MEIILPISVAKLVPHQPPMLLVDDLISLSDNSAVSQTVLDQICLFVGADNKIDEAVFFELVAQTFAAYLAAQRQETTPKKDVSIGFLVAIKRFSVSGQAKSGETLRTSIILISVVDDYYVVNGSITAEDRPIASGQVTVLVPSNKG